MKIIQLWKKRDLLTIFKGTNALNKDRFVKKKRVRKEENKNIEDSKLNSISNTKPKPEVQVRFEEKYGEDLEFCLALNKLGFDDEMKKETIDRFEKEIEQGNSNKSFKESNLL